MLVTAMPSLIFNDLVPASIWFVGLLYVCDRILNPTPIFSQRYDLVVVTLDSDVVTIIVNVKKQKASTPR